MRRARKYAVAEKREAVELAARLGAREASRKLGIPQGTLSCWRYKARQAEATGECWPPVAAEDVESGVLDGGCEGTTGGVLDEQNARPTQLVELVASSANETLASWGRGGALRLDVGSHIGLTFDELPPVGYLLAVLHGVDGEGP